MLAKGGFTLMNVDWNQCFDDLDWQLCKQIDRQARRVRE